jgi:hypothetical protein
MELEVASLKRDLELAPGTTRRGSRSVALLFHWPQRPAEPLQLAQIARRFREPVAEGVPAAFGQMIQYVVKRVPPMVR